MVREWRAADNGDARRRLVSAPEDTLRTFVRGYALNSSLRIAKVEHGA
jgi:hypothetical protein